MGIIILLIFAGVVALFVYLSNKAFEKKYIHIADTLRDELIVKLEQVKCETFCSGAKNGGYYFTHCDLLITEDAMIILGYSRFLSFKRLSVPLVLTTNPSFYFFRFPYAKLIQPKKINLNSFNGDIYIEFVNPGFIDTNVEIRLKDIPEEVKDKVNANLLIA